MHNSRFCGTKKKEYARRFGKQALADRAMEAWDRIVKEGVEVEDLIALQKIFWVKYQDDRPFWDFLVKADYVNRRFHGKITDFSKTILSLSHQYSWPEIRRMIKNRYHGSKNYRRWLQEVRALQNM